MGHQENVANSNREQVYGRKPIGFYQNIPVFSEQSDYTENYDKISHDHLASLRAQGTNPFIEEEHWLQMENSTRVLVEKYVRAGERILDTGVGLGRLLSHFPGLKRYGVDISFGYLLEAQKKGIEVCYALIEEMPYVDEVFDLVLCTDVLEHVLSLDACVTRILSVLKPGGILVIRVPYREALGVYTHKSYPYRYAHVRNFDEHSLNLLFTNCFGCEVLETSYDLYLPNTDRYRYPLPTQYGIRVQRKFLALMKKSWPCRYEKAVRAMVYPALINIVVRKPVSWKKPFAATKLPESGG